MKKKKTRGKTLLLLCLIACLMIFSATPFVSGEGETPSGGGVSTGGDDGGEASGKGESCNSMTGNSYVRWGIRVSIVGDDSKPIAGTHAINVVPKVWEKGAYVDWANGTFYSVSNGTKTKYEYLSSLSSDVLNGKDVTPVTETTWSGMGFISAEALISKAALALNIHNSIPKDYTGSKVTSDIKALYNYIATVDASNNYAWTDALFSLLGWNKKVAELTEEEISSTYVMFEPVMGLEVKTASTGCDSYHGVVATMTEMATILSPGTSTWSMGKDMVEKFGAQIYAPANCGYDKCAPKDIESYNNLAISAAKGRGAWRKLVDATTTQAVSYIWLGAVIQKEESCPEVIKQINAMKTGGKIDQSKYDDLVAKVKNGQLTLELAQQLNLQSASGKFLVMTQPQDYDYLDKTYYGDTTINPTGLAKCENHIPQPPTACDPSLAHADVYVDPCTNGQTYFRDDGNEDNWLKCETAYYFNGTAYSSDNTGHVATDVEAWQSDGRIQVSSKFQAVMGSHRQVGNKEFCEVFCREEYETYFPTSVTGIRAGRTFVWGQSDGTYGTVRIIKHCSNQDYNKDAGEGYRFKEWESKYKENERQLVTNWLDYNFNKWADDNIKVTHASDSTLHANGGCCAVEKTNPITGRAYCKTPGTKWTAKKEHPFTSKGNPDNNDWMKAYGSIDAKFNDYSCTSEDDAKNKVKSPNTQTYYNNYTINVAQEPEIMAEILECAQNIKYVYNAVVYFVFQEPVNAQYGPNSRQFQYDDELLIDPSKEDGYNKDNVDTSTCERARVYSYECSGSDLDAHCDATEEWVLDCSKTRVTWDIEGNWTYKYNAEDFQWYSLKIDSTLINKKEKPSIDDAYFYFLGFGLPTAFSLTDGTYDMKVVVGTIGDTGVTEGDQQYNVDNGHFWPLTDFTDHNVYGFEYQCTYEVINEIFGYDCQYAAGQLTGVSPEYCDPTDDGDSNGYLKGIDIVYRLIQLLDDTDSIDKAFPGIDGNGRNQGMNWKLPESDLHDILNSNVINNSNAMYELMLDVNAIQYIREDNKKYFDMGLDPYTSYDSESGGYKIICVGGTDKNKYCASTFLDDLQNLNGNFLNYPLMGTCLPNGLSAEPRAREILANGCGYSYVYPPFTWTR